MNTASEPTAAVLECLDALLQPLAQLALERGVVYADLDRALRRALVNRARRVNPSEYGRVSRISAATGLSRREVTRLLDEHAAPSLPKRHPVGGVLARWIGDAVYSPGGVPMALPRQGDEPSFETLARSVTSDVHPRTLLDEMCRLKLAIWNQDTDSVILQRRAFVPDGDFDHMLRLLAENVGEHFTAAVENLDNGRTHLEQAMFADELSAESIEFLKPLLSARWHRLASELLPILSQRIENDRTARRAQNHKIRIGFYTYSDAVPPTKPDLQL